ncbi:hypothetical protein MSAN_01866800 [Mycena sanguinolenta]|uniref:Uncharacterized protein n=1 Tax=Mycena sanguinolenta TaxID=230812 RepID=A0A8H7CQE7_9AGAR|nr:hypothetical protein MSAN_01866800 [Mycena sanguinolenta]
MPTLPSELEREIFEIAIRDNHNNAAWKLNFSLVARRVQYWIDLVYYEVVTIKTPVQAHKFLELVDWKPHDFFALAVKSLCIAYSISAVDASRILSVCSNVQQLACWVPWEKSPNLTQLLNSLCRLNQLSIETGHFLSILRSQSTPFPGLTHLELKWWLSSPRTSLDLGALPNLTHVSLSRAGRSEAESVCLTCASLQVLVIQKLAPEEEYAFDARIVMAPSDITYGEPVEVWEDVAFRRPENMWAYAENVVLSRKQKLDGRWYVLRLTYNAQS